MIVKSLNEATGEVIELESNNLDELVKAWKVAQQYEKVSINLKDQLKKLVPKYINDKGVSEESSDAMFRVSSVQRMTYDKSVARNIFDEDTFDLFTKIDKKKVDDYIKENLSELGDVSTKLRESMIPDGQPYQVIKLEKVRR